MDAPLTTRAGAPRLLDCFCCEGGASTGYSRAGFAVTGTDIKRRRAYPFAFILADFFEIEPSWIGANFDAVHASPECQGYTAMRHAKGAKGRPRRIPEVIERLNATGLPWVLENVEEAACDMPGAVTLCGSMFGLGSHGCQLRRHRLFISNISISAPSPCRHDERPVMGVFGGHARIRSAKHGGRGTRDDWGADGHGPPARGAMDMPWATLAGMSEAIPPAYTQHLGAQLLAAIQIKARAA